ncbi:MAG TPA: hypothetical protein VJ785_07310 [Anaerolineales bacterium]|nr:hypothetical protein [Anaerolineales bacterium]
MDASVVAIASSIGTPGVGTALLGKEQDVKNSPRKSAIKDRLIRRLYNFSEQIVIVDVYKGIGVKMKIALPGISIVILLLTACSTQAQPTDLPVEVGEGATEVSENPTAAEDAAIAALSQNLGIPADQIEVVSVEAVEWPDACLGVVQEGVACAQVMSPGYKIILEANGKQVEYHTDETGAEILPATLALTWKREGGIAGFCDQLTIYLSGEVQASNCKTTQMVESPLTEVHSPEEIAGMNEWVSEYGVVEIDASDPKGVADAMTVNLTLYGLGTEQLLSPEEEKILLQFAQDTYQEVMNQ